MVGPGEKLGGLARVCCVDPDCHVTGSCRVVINSILREGLRVSEAGKSGLMNSARNTFHLVQTTMQGRNVIVPSY